MSDDLDLDLPEPSGPSAATRDAIRAAVAGDIEPVHSLSVGQRVLLGLGGAVIAAALVIGGAGSTGWAAAPAAPLLVLGLVALVGSALVGRSLAPSSRFGGALRVGLAGGLLAAWTSYLALMVARGPLQPAFDAMALGCAGRAFLAGAVASAIFLWAWRRTDPWSPRAAGLLIGMGGGAVGCAALGVVCAADHAGHLAVGHWLAAPLVAIAAALLAPKILSP